jgi:signal transduction histidine kinase
MTMVSTPGLEGAQTNHPWAVITVAVATVLAFVLDLSPSASGAERFAYPGMILLGWWLARPRDVIALAVLATLLIAAGQTLSPAFDQPAALAQSGLAMLAVWATAGVVATAKRHCEALRRDRDAARAQVREQAARLSATRTHAELTNRTASDLLSGMSHELRTPLNAIIGFSEIVRTEMFGPIGSDRYREYLRDIHESGRHLLVLINTLLDVARIDAGKVEIASDEVDIPGMIRTCLAEVAERAEAAGITLSTGVADDLPMLRADRQMLAQVLHNLLSNAVKFTASGGRVTVSAWCRPSTGCVLQVRDTGKGIALKDIPLALAPFGQIAETPRRYQGTGLGLPLSKALVELHAGSLDLQSELGAGTTVTIRLPAERIGAMPKVA